MTGIVSELVLDQRLAALEAARTWSPRVISKLESHVRSADDAGLFRINPIRFAADKNIVESEAIDLFLHGTAQGLFEMDWLLYCPLCSCIVEAFRSLRSVGSHYHCPMCHCDYQAVLDEYVAVTFTMSPAIRRIAFHEPETLAAVDYVFGYKLSEAGIRPDGTPIAAVLRRCARIVSYLPPGLTTPLAIEAEAGTLLGLSVDSDTGFAFDVAGAPTASPQVVIVEYLENESSHLEGVLAPGPVVFEVANRTGRRGVLCVVQADDAFALEPLTFDPFLTGKRLLTTQTFGDLFRSEVVGAAEGIGVKDVTVLFTDLKGSTALYGQIGDLNAFALVQQHFGRLREATVDHGGAIIKTIGDAVMAVFPNAADAVKAALAMLQRIAAFNEGRGGTSVMVKVGLHKGAAITVTLNDRLDYFGQTINIAARVQALADAGEIYLTQEVYETAGTAQLLSDCSVERSTAQLRGVGGDVVVYRVMPNATPAQAAAVSP